MPSLQITPIQRSILFNHLTNEEFDCQISKLFFFYPRGRKMFDPRFFVRFDFVVCETITNVPFYRGKHLNSMFKVLFESYYKELSESSILFKLGIKTISIQNGCNRLVPGENISVVLSFPAQYKETVQDIITHLRNRNLDKYEFPLSSHFNPQKTINFQEAFCCRCNNKWTINCQPITETDLQAEVEKLCRLSKFTLQFYTPLRLKRIKGDQTKYTYFNHEYFTAGNFLSAIVNSEKKQQQNLQITDRLLIWLDCAYNPDQRGSTQQTLGGICGYVTFQSKPILEMAKLLVYGQYTGIGKSTTIGFGFYTIQELKNENHIIQPTKPSLLEEFITPQNLKKTLSKMNNHSPGPDGITVEDLKDISTDYMQILAKLIINRKFRPSETIEYKKIKYNHQVRQISISNMTDRLVAKLLTDKLSDIFDPILSNRAYAYRPGRSVKKSVSKVQNHLKSGFFHVIKTDIADFFSSIQTDKLFFLLKALFHNDDLVSLIATLYSEQNGLTQGNPLSPFLSNLYMLVFDDLINSKKYRYIRYADDMLIMTKDAAELADLLMKIKRLLKLLNLELNKSKIRIIKNAQIVEFLGHKISKNRIQKIPVKKAEVQEMYHWLPVFNYNYRKGIAVYITFNTHMVRTEQTNLIIHKADNSRESIPWSQVNRFVVIGRARISAGVIRKALYYRLPVSFLSIRGKNIGAFNPHNRLYNVKDIYNSQVRSFTNFQLSFVRSIVETKIHNQKMILSRSKIKEPRLVSYQKKIFRLTDIDKIRGYEGAASNIFFDHLRELVKPFPFEKREYHPAIGPVNVLLSIGYSLIYNRIGEALISNGLNPYYGIYHYPRGRHMALSSDLVECFRFIAERVMLSLIHLKKVKLEDFIELDKNGYSYTQLNKEGMRAYLHRFEWIMNQEVRIKDENNPVKYEQLFDLVINRLIRSLRLGIIFKTIKVR